jgi:hypothetical protein
MVRCYLAQVVEVLQHWNLPEEQPVGDGLAHHEAGDQVLGVDTSLSPLCLSWP